MRAVDTNVVVRYLRDDHPEQAAQAQRLIGRETVWLGLTVVLETEWVLRKGYGISRGDIVAALRQLSGQPTIALENPEALARALDLVEHGMDFADALHIAVASRCSGFATFDVALMKAAARAGIPNVMLP